MKKLLLVLGMWLAMMGAALAQVNINTATKEQLDGLKGIGPAKAQAIIDYRTKNGPFKTVDDLEKVNGIGPGTMKDLRSGITVADGKAAPAKAEKKADKKAEAKEPAKVDANKDDKKAAAKKEAKADAKKDDKNEKAEKKADAKKDAKKDEAKDTKADKK
jgi:competence protein ComEA